MKEDAFDVDLFDAENNPKLKLTPFQEKFCLLYHQNNNATKSYMEAYGNSSIKAARSNSSKLLKTEKIKIRMKQLQKDVRKKYKINTEDLIRVNAEVAFSKLSEVARITSTGEVELIYDEDDSTNIDNLDGISFSKTKSSYSSDKGDSESESTSISLKRPDRTKAAQELARLIGAYDEAGDDKENKRTAAQKLLESLAKFKKKDK